MATDISKTKSENPIKNGSLIVSTTFTGTYSKSDTYVKNTPTITDIENKYDIKFDDITYYTIGNATLVGG